MVQQVFRTTPVPLTDLSAVDALPLSYTYHGYGLDTPCKIDYLLGTPEWKPEGQKLGTWHHNGVFLSDHFPVVAELLLK